MSVFLGRFQSNWKSGLTVALVSIPLSISLAIASGATPIMGIITAVWAGLIASFFGGSNFNIVGPAGALSGILAAYALVHGYTTLPLVAIAAGVMILIAYAFRLERFIAFVPGSTIHGFTLGVGIIIALNQLNFAFGLSGLPKHEEFIKNVWETLTHLGQSSLPTYGVFALFFIALFLLLKLTPKIPGALTVAPLGILFGYLTTIGIIDIPLETIGSKFGDIKATLISLPDLSFNSTILISAGAVAFVAILETMLSAKIADGMTKTTYNDRKEMVGLGLANLASGVTGGLPATGVLVRTAINIKAGGNHKTSQGLNAIFVGLISLILFPYFKFLPMAVIGAMLIFSAIRMVESEHFVRFYRHDRRGFWIAIAVAAITVYKDPTFGLLFGTTISLLLLVEKLSRGQFDLKVNTPADGLVSSVSGEQLTKEESLGETNHVLVYSIKGQLAYINSQAHLSRFQNGLNGYQAVILRLRELNFIDIDGVDAIDDLIELIEQKGKQVAITGANNFVAKLLADGSEHFSRLTEAGLVFEKTEQALNQFGVKIQ